MPRSAPHQPKPNRTGRKHTIVCRNDARSRAVTLVETLAAASLLVVCLGILYGLWSTMAGMDRHDSKRQELERLTVRLFTSLRQDIRLASLLRVQGELLEREQDRLVDGLPVRGRVVYLHRDGRVVRRMADGERRFPLADCALPGETLHFRFGAAGTRSVEVSLRLTGPDGKARYALAETIRVGP